MKNKRKSSWMNKSNLLISFITLIVTIVTLWYTIPKESIEIFYDPIKSNAYYTLSNIGDIPLTDIKTGYKIDCQKIFFNSTYIEKEVPQLTPSTGSNPFYVQQFDNRTQKVLQNAFQNKDKCNNANVSEISIDVVEMYSKTTNETYEIYFCDSCELIINFESREIPSKTKSFNFTNPVKALLQINRTAYTGEICQGSDACAYMLITFPLNADDWNSYISPKDVSMRTDDNLRPTKIFLRLTNSK